MNWIEYAQAAQRLADLRRREEQRLAGVRERTAGMRTEVEPLRRRLVLQRDRLTRTAKDLRLAAPDLGGVSPSGVSDPAELGQRTNHALEQADALLKAVDDRAREPGLLPGVHPTLRNGLVYAGATVLAGLLSCGLTIFGTRGPDHRFPLWTAPWALCGLPAVAFFAGYFIIGSLGRPRLGSTGPLDRSVRLGGLICLLGLWLIWAIGVSVNLGTN
jgi:hypothetical protein